MDGTITIGTRIDESGFDKDYKELQKKYSEIPVIEANANSEELKEQINLTEELERNEEKRIAFKEKILELSEIDTNLLFEDKEFVQYITEKLAEQGIQAETLLKSEEGRYAIIQAIAEELDLEVNKIGEIPGKLDNINKNLKEHNNSISKTLRTIKRWTLSILGVSSAYGAMRKIINLLSEDNEQFKADIQYIGWGLKQAVLTVLESIGITAEKVINVIKKLLFYIAYIIKQWTGKNIFENASLDKYNKSLKKTSSGLKEIRKQLAGFDEANVLNANTGQVNGLGVTIPSFDFGDWADEFNKLKPPSWVEWIAENKFAIQTLAEMALGIFGVATITSWVKNIAGFLAGGELGALGSTLTNLGVIAGGIIITYICAKQVWDDLKRLHDELIQIADDGFKGQQKWLDETEPAIEDVFNTWAVNLYSTSEMYNGIKSIMWDILGIINELQGKDDVRLELIQKQAKLAQQQFDYMINYYNKGKMTEAQQKRLLNILKNQKSENDEIIKKLKEQGKSTKEIEGYNQELEGQIYAVSKGIQYNDDFTKLWGDSMKICKENANGTYETILDINDTDISDKTVTVGADLSEYNTSMDSVKNSKNVATVEVEGKTDKLKTGIVGAIGAALGSITVKPLGVAGLGALAGKTLKNLFKFAKGGIINQPGRGIPIGYNVIAGEAGREGIVPLTDAQQMELLGQSIGKYVQIDNVIDINMDSYKINRILKQSQERANFSANR